MIKEMINKLKTFSTKDKKNKNTQDKVKIKGIDVSFYQGAISWKDVSKTDIKFIILRGTTKNGALDTCFWKNLHGARAYGFKDISVYHFSYALDTKKAIADAKNLIKKLNNEKLVIWLDLEWIEQGKLGKDKVTEIATAFVNTCKDLGYECNIYSNVDWYKNYYHADKLKALGCKFWIARYGTNEGFLQEKFKPNLGEYIWQYTSKGRVQGVSGDVDLNIKYETLSETENSDDEIITNNKMVKVICNSINKRSTPTTSSDNIKGVYKKDTIIKIVGITENKKWYKDNKGYYFTSNNKYVIDLTGIVFNCYKLNLRSKNNSNSDIVKVLNQSDKLFILNESKNWYYVKTENGLKGWVHKYYVKLN